MKKYFYPFFLSVLFSGCSMFEPTYFISNKKISQIDKKVSAKKEIDRIKWIVPKEESKKSDNFYKGFVIYRKYDSSLKLWKYAFESVKNGENVEFYYDKKLGYDGDLVKIFLEKRDGINFLKDIVLISENYQQNRYIRSLSSEELSKNKRLKKRTINRINWKLGIPQEEKIDIK